MTWVKEYSPLHFYSTQDHIVIMSLRIALFQPEIPQNAGAILRLCACFDAPLEVVEPCGFVWSDRKLKRAGMDYIAKTHVTRHPTWQAFRDAVPGRLVLATTQGAVSAYDFNFQDNDILLFGMESAGVPPAVHDDADARIRIPIRAGTRSLNVSMAAGMILAEALRQTGGLSDTPAPP